MVRLKKIVLLLFLLCISGRGFTQKVLLDVVDHYYLHNPFSGSFSVFLKTMINDARLTKKIIHKRTDSTLFFFKAEYVLYNPFSFTPTRTEIILAESEIQFSDTAAVADTILVYQLIGYAGFDLKTVKSEFTRFERKYGKRFTSSNFSDIMNKDQLAGGTHNYFLNLSQVSPLSVSWGKFNNTETAYIVTVRLVREENEAMLPYVP